MTEKGDEPDAPRLGAIWRGQMHLTTNAPTASTPLPHVSQHNSCRSILPMLEDTSLFGQRSERQPRCKIVRNWDQPSLPCFADFSRDSWHHLSGSHPARGNSDEFESRHPLMFFFLKNMHVFMASKMAKPTKSQDRLASSETFLEIFVPNYLSDGAEGFGAVEGRAICVAASNHRSPCRTRTLVKNISDGGCSGVSRCEMPWQTMTSGATA